MYDWTSWLSGIIMGSCSVALYFIFKRWLYFKHTESNIRKLYTKLRRERESNSKIWETVSRMRTGYITSRIRAIAYIWDDTHKTELEIGDWFWEV